MTIHALPGDLPARLRAAGLKVVEIPGWQTRGRPASTGAFNPVGVLNHHTGDTASGKDYAAGILVRGRADLAGPLCHLSLGRDGTVYVVAAGRANHAGVAKSVGTVAAGDGNALYVGIEWQLTGLEPIPAVMYDAGATLNAVLLDLLGSSEQTVHCHYETSVTGKWDIGDPAGIKRGNARVLDVAKFQARVKAKRALLHPAKPTPVPTPPVKSKRPKSAPPAWSKFLHIADYLKNDSVAGLKWGHDHGYTSADMDAHVGADGTWWWLHWGDLRGYTLKGRAFRKSINTLNRAEVLGARSKYGALHSLDFGLQQAARLGYKRAEVEPKDVPTVEQFRHLKAVGDKYGIEIVVKRLSNIPGAAKCLRNAHAAGLPTMLLSRGPRVFSKAKFWPVTDYVRGPVLKWVA